MNQRLQTRLRRIEGQVRGRRRMIDEDAYGIDVLTQISAATPRPRRAAGARSEDHIADSVHEAASAGVD